MRNARILRRELDLWKLAWQQIETFLQRIDGARDQDEPHRRKLDGLLRAARAVEHERAARVDDRPLSDPVVDAMPSQWYSEQQGTQTVTAPWLADFRQWRIPGMDEVELAVGNLQTQNNADTPVLEQVLLLPDQDIFEIRLDPSDRRFPESTNGLLMTRLPSYPRATSGISIVGPVLVLAEIEEVNNTSSLFSRDARLQATTAPSPDTDPVRVWSNLCAVRRGRLPSSAAEYDRTVKYTGPTAGPQWRMVLMAEARGVIADVRAGRATLNTTASEVLTQVESGARAAASIAATDAQALTIAADVIEQEGAQVESFPDQLRAAATLLQSRPTAFLTVADAAAALRAALQATDRATTLESALNTLEAALQATHPLFNVVAEMGLLQPEIDAVVQARVAYPDGTLRIVRALEWGFISAWPAHLRWFSIRHRSVLQPLLARFRKPFMDGVSALLQGGYTGLMCDGLHLETAAQVGSESLTTAQPASMLPTLEATLASGQVGILEGPRPTAMVVLGVEASNRRIVLKTSPLLVSVAAQTADVPGAPGLATGNQPILCVAPGLTREELQLGESAAGQASDGLLHQTLALWSQLCLVFGWLVVERVLQGSIAITEAQLHSRLIPDPSNTPLERLNLHGEIPPYTATLVVQGAPDTYWDRTTYPPEPHLARPREFLLLRGRSESEVEGIAGPLVQSAVEVETVYRITGSMLAHMDTSNAALLSTTPLPIVAGDQTPALVCGPEEDVIVVLLHQSWQTKKLVGEITLRRDFPGFDAPSLAAERLLPVSFLHKIMTPAAVIDDGGIDRHDEFTAALKLIADWTRYAR